MKTMITNFIRPIIACALISLSATFSWGSSKAVDRAPHREINIHEMNQNAPMAKILPVLESKISDQKLLEKAKEKLAAMGDAEIRLIASLCERISGDRGTPDADIAFLLVTALIVLS